MPSSKTREPAKHKAARKRRAPASGLVTNIDVTNIDVANVHENSVQKKARKEPTSAAITRVDGSADDEFWTLRLYVAGDSPKSRSALANLRRLCDTHLEGKYEIEVIDLKSRPELAKADQILALPTLIRKLPEPMKRLIGDLSNTERAMVALELGGATTRGRKSGKHARHMD